MSEEVVSARLDIQVHVSCPHCDYLIDLLDERDTDGVAYDDDGNILKEVCPARNWIESHEKFELEDVTCSCCKEVFNMKTIEW